MVKTKHLKYPFLKEEVRTLHVPIPYDLYEIIRDNEDMKRLDAIVTHLLREFYADYSEDGT